MTINTTQFLNRTDKPSLAYVHSPATQNDNTLPAIIFCGGYRSDMQGTKATYFEDQARTRGQDYIRFDYSGHGESQGEFKDGCIGDWFHDALDIFDALINKPTIIIGSSMGGWIGLLLARARPDLTAAYIGIAAAPDFTQRLYDIELNNAQREAMNTQGYVEIPNDYSDEPYFFTKKLVDDGKDNSLLNTQHAPSYPMHLFHGLKDTTVPKETPLKIQQQYGEGNVEITFIDDGDHRLSRPQDLTLIQQKIDNLSR